MKASSRSFGESLLWVFGNPISHTGGVFELEGPRMFPGPIFWFYTGTWDPQSRWLVQISKLEISRTKTGRELPWAPVQWFFFPHDNRHLLRTEMEPASKVSWEMPCGLFFFISMMHFLFHFEKTLPNCSLGSDVSVRRRGLSCLEITMNNHSLNT